MKARVRRNYGGTWIEVDCENVKEAIQALDEYGEVFGESDCGSCGSKEIGPQHRIHDDNEYYSLRCVNCGSQLDLGQHKTGGTLFAKRKLENGEYDQANRGWYRFGDHRGGAVQ